MRMKEKCAELGQMLRSLRSLTIYRNMLQLPVLRQVERAMDAALEGRSAEAAAAWCEVSYLLLEQGCGSLADYVTAHLREDDSPYAAACARGTVTAAMKRLAQRDLAILLALVEGLVPTWASHWQQEDGAEGWPVDLPSELLTCSGITSAEELLASLEDSYRTHGTGLFARYRAFLWQEGALYPVEEPDYIPPERLVGYRRQRDQVQENTAALVAGKRVNNVLLYGESGTGKSATVKSMLGVPEFSSLRLVEIDKGDLAGIPQLVRMLAGQPQRFILFIDDLAFDRDDRTYSMLKTILEGGLSQKPANVAIYATSNRRHLVRETFTDRLGDEVDKAETIEEKTSLSERFGLRIPFSSLNQEQYVNLCYRLAEQAGLNIPQEVLRPRAIQFNLRHPGRTPRVAQQFVHALIAEKG